MIAKNTGRSYEQLTQAIFAALLKQDLATTVTVNRNVTLKGKSGEHEVDVHWKFELAGVTYETIVQCKDWASAVHQGAVLTFKAVLDDLPGQPRGIFVARSGYQKGAREIAEKNGIDLYELRPLGVGERGPSVRLLLRLFEPEVSGFKPILDEAWAETERRRIGASANRQFQGAASVTTFDDESGVPRITVRELVNSLVPGGFTSSPPTEYTHLFTGPTYVVTGIPESPRMKVTGVRVTIAVQESEEESTTFLGDIAQFILTSTTRGSTVKVDGHGNPV